MRRLFANLMVVVGLLWITTSAQAATGYVCYTRLTNPPSYGSAGGLYVLYYSSPGCTGNFQGAYYYCSKGATASVCSNSTHYHYTDSQLTSFMEVLQNAGVEGNKVSHYTTPCKGGGGSSCGGYFYLYTIP